MHYESKEIAALGGCFGGIILAYLAGIIIVIAAIAIAVRWVIGG